jgi:adenine/guanine phosphoribosyltransferase-like PRPP-binding protein
MPTKKRKKIKHEIRTSYLSDVYSKAFLKLVPEVVKHVKRFRKKHPFDAIAFRGSSGAALAFPLSFFLKIPLIHVRKDDKNHYGRSIEGTISSKRYLIVDDTIYTGFTIDTILETIENEYQAAGVRAPRPVGICLFAEGVGGKGTYNGLPVFYIPEVQP